MNKKIMIGTAALVLVAFGVILLSQPANDSAISGSVTQELPAGSQGLSVENVMQALGEVMDPEVPEPIVKVLNLKPEDIEIEGGVVRIRLNIPEYCPMKEKIISSVSEKISQIKGVKKVEVLFKEGN